MTGGFCVLMEISHSKFDSFCYELSHGQCPPGPMPVHCTDSTRVWSLCSWAQRAAQLLRQRPWGRTWDKVPEGGWEADVRPISCNFFEFLSLLSLGSITVIDTALKTVAEIVQNISGSTQ